MEIRLLNEEDDIDAVCGIYAASWKSTYRGIIPQEFLDNIDKEKWREGIQNSELISLVMMNGEKMIGTAPTVLPDSSVLRGLGKSSRSICFRITMEMDMADSFCRRRLTDCLRWDFQKK